MPNDPLKAQSDGTDVNTGGDGEGLASPGGDSAGTAYPVASLITRRQIMKYMGMAGIAGVLAACRVGEQSVATTNAGSVTTAPGGATTAPGGATTLAMTPLNMEGVIYGDVLPTLPRGGSLVVGTTEQVPNTLDVLRNALGATGWNTAPAQDFLEHYDHNSILRLSLTESLEVVDDTTLRYTLREASFHTGNPVNSQAVQDIFDWIQDEANGSHLASRIAGVTIEPENDRTFLFRLDEPNAVVRGNLPRIPIMPIEFAGNGEESVGAGPFIFDGWERDSFVDYRRNPDYWNPEAPRLDNLRIRHFAESTAGTQTFFAGEMDYLYPASFPQFEAIKQRVDAGEFNMVVTEPGWCYLVCNNARTPFDNPKVRQAVMYAMDRQRMAEVGFGGADGVGRVLEFPVVPEHAFYPSDLSVSQDLDRARSLLAEAGYEGGFSAEGGMISPDFTYFEAIGTIAQQNLAEIGIEIDLVILDISSLIERAIGQSDFDITVLGSALDPELGVVLDRLITTDGGSNYFNYSNPAVDSALRDGRTTFDEDARRSAYHEALRLCVVEDAGLITVTNEPLINLYRDNTNGADYKPDPLAIWHWPIASTSNT